MSTRLRVCLLAYPRGVRAGEGDVLAALALDMVDGGSPTGREARGLLAGGLATRFGPAPWRPALAAAAPTAVWILAGAVFVPDWAGLPALGLGALIAAALVRRMVRLSVSVL